MNNADVPPGTTDALKDPQLPGGGVKDLGLTPCTSADEVDDTQGERYFYQAGAGVAYIPCGTYWKDVSYIQDYHCADVCIHKARSSGCTTCYDVPFAQVCVTPTASDPDQYVEETTCAKAVARS